MSTGLLITVFIVVVGTTAAFVQDRKHHAQVRAAPRAETTLTQPRRTTPDLAHDHGAVVVLAVLTCWFVVRGAWMCALIGGW